MLLEENTHTQNVLGHTRNLSPQLPLIVRAIFIYIG